MHDKIAGHLTDFGGILRCENCGKACPIGGKEQIAYRLANGWPKCCEHTMRWVTDKELADERKED